MFRHHKGNSKGRAGGEGSYIKNIRQCTKYTQGLDLNSADCANLRLKMSLKNGKGNCIKSAIPISKD